MADNFQHNVNAKHLFSPFEISIYIWQPSAVLPSTLTSETMLIHLGIIISAFASKAHVRWVFGLLTVCPLLRQEITGGMGVDVAVEALGRPATFMQCANSVRDGGKAVMIGLAAAGSMGQVDINRLVRRQVILQR